jgi:hypothetical protein
MQTLVCSCTCNNTVQAGFEHSCWIKMQALVSSRHRLRLCFIASGCRNFLGTVDSLRTMYRAVPVTLPADFKLGPIPVATHHRASNLQQGIANHITRHTCDPTPPPMCLSIHQQTALRDHKCHMAIGKSRPSQDCEGSMHSGSATCWHCATEVAHVVTTACSTPHQPCLPAIFSQHRACAVWQTTAGLHSTNYLVTSCPSFYSR